MVLIFYGWGRKRKTNLSKMEGLVFLFERVYRSKKNLYLSKKE